MKTRVVERSELYSIVSGFPFTPVVGILLVGDRLSCCDEGIVVEDDGRVVAVATIAPDGEEGSGEPTIVACYVLRADRRKGFGRACMTAAVERCCARGFARVRVDAVSTGGLRLNQSLPEELREILDIHDMTSGVDLDFLESLMS